ncbi:MAG: NAD-dependent epimerase/dehydratase family protein [Candidatus Thorarchaeota archaeon]|nr:NAD-dependent epimerase/dehydratase family protein [Candidatus Thorarchaeota archaeon]
MDSGQVLSHYNDKKILITGGAGCIGSNLVRTLLSVDPAKITVLDDFSASFPWNLPKHPLLQVIEGSVLDEQKLKQVFYENPDFVIHLAAHFANQNSIDHPETDLMVNGLGLLRVLEYSRLMEPKRVIFAGSGCSVYGSHAEIPFKEGTVSLTLDTPYQIHKLLGELYCNHYHEIFGLPTVIGRFFNVYGPGEVPGQYRNVIPVFMWLAMHDRPLPVMGKGEETRDFAYVDDIVDGILRMGVIDGAVGEAMNLASGTETSVRSLADLVIEITGSKGGWIQKPKRDWDRSNRRLASIEKAKRILGYNPKKDFKEGLVTVYNWLETNRENVVESLGPSAGLW